MASHGRTFAAAVVILCILTECTASGRLGALQIKAAQSGTDEPARDPKPTFKGYLPVASDGSELYYAYWEAGACVVHNDTPIILWLQGGPGCASSFGAFYELGPYSVTWPNLTLVPNPGSWNRISGLLILDQPLGTGLSPAPGNASIPTDEMGMAGHLYNALQGFFTRHARLAARPLFITGESYAGKYVPSIAHYILQLQQQAAAAATGSDQAASSSRQQAARMAISLPGDAAAQVQSATRPGRPLRHTRPIPLGVPPPVFRLAGVAVGNGLTDPRTQTLTLADSAYFSGLLPPAQRQVIADRAAQVVTLIDSEAWMQAHEEREALRKLLTNVSGLGTMFDTRRSGEYDPHKSVDAFLNLPEVRAALGAKQELNYSSCSEVVGDIMAADTMRSVKHLLPDVLDHLPVLLYQGQFDILDGVASSTAWIDTLDWHLQGDLARDPGALWHHNDTPAGWWRSAGNLLHAVVYHAGHMVPHDQPEAAQALIETWIGNVLGPERSQGAAGCSTGATASSASDEAAAASPFALP
mmetsp:Transcript_37071/g.82444  ORF Transcript_37071/g.82444 Transcript_37071/m.82444 type:complete len:527 (-) Transcript_37071:417-1997(-)